MTHSEIESFLAICRYKTVSAAAEKLYITQSSLSTRLKTLEKELGGALFYRRKGSREMLLTAAGKQFFELAVQYESLIKQMGQVFENTPRSLKISSLNSVDTFLLLAVYERFLQRYPDIKLEIQDLDSQAATVSIQNGETDLAFTSGKNKNDGIKSRLAFIEPMVLISSDMDMKEPVSIDRLSVHDEIHIEWSLQFAHWHQQAFGDVHPQITVSIMPHLQKFMEHESVWAIVPLSVAQSIIQNGNVRQLVTDFDLPKREMSILSPADKRDNAAVLAFFECLREALKSYDEIDIEL